jgi:hypothetical protein
MVYSTHRHYGCDEGQQVSPPNGMFPAQDNLNELLPQRALQSHAQKLGEQVTSMTAKIKELEFALAAAHLQIRANSDPPESPGDTTKSLRDNRRRSCGVGTGSLAIDNEGVARYFGDTSAPEVSSQGLALVQ